MSTENTTETLTETAAPVAEAPPAKPKRESTPKRPSIKLAVIQALATEMGMSPTLKDGQETKSFVHYGHKGGVEVHVAKNEDVTRVFIKKVHLDDQVYAVENFYDQRRKDEGLGNVYAEVDFEQGTDAALEAIKAALQAAKDAPAPVKPVKAPKASPTPAEGVPVIAADVVTTDAEAAPVEATA